MRAFVIDDEFFNQSAIEATPRSSCRPALEKRLDTADIVRDVCIVAFPDKWPVAQLLPTGVGVEKVGAAFLSFGD
jgi:hypothetical protein